MDFKRSATSAINQIRSHVIGNDVVKRGFWQFVMVCAAAAIIWTVCPLLSWNEVHLFEAINKRLSLVSILFLCWLLKFLIIDLELPNPLEYKDPRIQRALLELQQRLAGFMKFLINTTVMKDGTPAYLSQLPWYIVLGPQQAGKSSLMAESGVHFILRKQSKASASPTDASNTIDWWVTRHSCLIDIPGRYLYTPAKARNGKIKNTAHATLWRYLLHLIRYWRGKQGINGIMIALPLPDIIKQQDTHQYQDMLNHLSMRIHELQKIFPHPIPCQLIITKCDLLPGFTEFFTEASVEDLNLPWGISLPPLKKGESPVDVFNRRFDALTKRLNEQLLWRLHHEHDPQSKPLIKQFPLSVESLRGHLITLIRKLSTGSHSITLNNLFLTSSLQPQYQRQTEAADPNSQELIATSERAIQRINQVNVLSHPYFIKQLISKTIADTLPNSARSQPKRNIYKYAAGLCGLALLSLAFVIVSHDFKQSSEYLYGLKRMVAVHELAIKKTVNPEDRLAQTLDLIDQLHTASLRPVSFYQLPMIAAWYSNDTHEKAAALYQQALSQLLLAEAGNYLDSYLAIPVNKDIEDVYAALKSYLMLANPAYLQPDFLLTTIQRTLPRAFTVEQRRNLNNYLYSALHQRWQPITINQARVQATRSYLDGMPANRLAYIILKNMINNNASQEINLGTTRSVPVFVSQQVSNQVPSMFTAKSFPFVYSKEIQAAALEAIQGNWVLGSLSATANAADTNALTQQLAVTYINNYIDIWESLLANIHVANPSNLSEINTMIAQLISTQSPLLQLLQTLHTNTYFDPIASNSPKLYSLGLLLEKNQRSQHQLYQIFLGLSRLHHYVDLVESAPNKNKAAFDLLASRMKNPNVNSPITELKLIASDKPEPLKSWLENIADQTLRLMMQQAEKYIDLSWQEQVSPLYQNYIANRYPFSDKAVAEVSPINFSRFFGNPGIVLNFYHQYLMPFVDTTKSEWRWKSLEGKQLPFSTETLRQIQQAVRIHRTFFPNDDDKLFVQFTLQPYEVDNTFTQIKLSINDKTFINDTRSATLAHTFSWPGDSSANQTTVQLDLADRQTVRQAYAGAWGWFKLLNQSYDSMINKKEIVINLSKNKDSAKYLIHTNSPINPLLAQNLSYFHLPEHIS